VQQLHWYGMVMGSFMVIAELAGATLHLSVDWMPLFFF
jgi:hypothetical protein